MGQFDKKLITIADIRAKARSIEASFNAVKFQGYVLEVQRDIIKPLLGDDLYIELMNDFTEGTGAATQKYQELLNGKVYTLNGRRTVFEGLELVVIYHVLFLIAKEGNIDINDIGPRVYREEFSERPTTSMDKDIYWRYQSIANKHAEAVVDFLNENKAVYPEWLTDPTSEQESQMTDFFVTGSTYHKNNQLL